MKLALWLSLTILLWPAYSSAQLNRDLEERDLLVLLGGTFIERDQTFGHFETRLTALAHGARISVRNLGWSGDTVFCPARSYFGPPEEGFERLAKNLADINPTRIVSCYGAVEAFEGEAGLANFIAGYQRLLDMLAKTGAKIILMSPPPLENLPPPLPDQDGQNRNLAKYRDAIAALAKQRGHGFADLFAALGEGRAKHSPPLTENGVHFTDSGYARIAPRFTEALGLRAQAGARIVEPGAAMSFTLMPQSLTEPSVRLAIRDLPAGEYSLKAGNEVLLTASSFAWATGLEVFPSAIRQQAAQLRYVIGKKNQLFFHRWRPQNETYLFGFRKYEQGNNAIEIPQFDPLVTAQEDIIHQLQKPAELTFTITKNSPVAP